MRLLLILFLTLTFLLTSFEASLAQKTKENIETQEESFSIDDLESMMMDDEELNKINKALEFFGEGREYTQETPENEEVQEEISDAERENIALSKEMQLIEEKSRVYLGSILYFNNKVWSAWVGDKKITSLSNSQDQEIFIEKINGKKVDIIWTIGASKWKILMGSQSDAATPKTNELNQIKIKFTLHPNQTYLLRTNEVVEGKKFNKKAHTTQTKTNTEETNELKQ